MAHIEVKGIVGKTPELRYTERGDPWTGLQLAEGRKVGGERIQVYWDVVAFGTNALILAETIERGMELTVRGRGELRTREVNGEARVERSVVVEMFGARGKEKATEKADGTSPVPTGGTI